MSDRLNTARLILRPVGEADIDDLVAFAGDADVALMTARIPHPYTRRDGEHAVRSFQQGDQQGTGVTFAIERGDDHQFMGVVGLELPSDQSVGILGYWLGKPFWGCGYMTEAAARVVEHCFETLNLDAVRATALSENQASINVQEKIGFGFKKIISEPRPARGDTQEVPLREITRQEWHYAHRS